MMRLVPLLLFALSACQNEAPAANNAMLEQQQAEAPVRDVDVIPADENAAAAVGEGDDAPPP